MSKTRKYGAIFFLTLFLFPSGYQAIHAIRHHSHQPYSVHYVHAVLIPFNPAINCPILQFQLFQSDQIIEKDKTVSFSHSFFYNESIRASFLQSFSGNIIKLRAPPSLNFL